MGFESSGVITKIGADTSHGFKVGDRVCALISRGSWSTYTRLHWTGIAKIPDSTTFELPHLFPWFSLQHTIASLRSHICAQAKVS